MIVATHKNERIIAFEIQRSPLTNDKFWERTHKYINQGIIVLWIFLKQDVNFYRMKLTQINAFKLYKKKFILYDHLEKPNFLKIIHLANCFGSINDFEAGRFLKTRKIVKKVDLFAFRDIKYLRKYFWEGILEK